MPFAIRRTAAPLREQVTERIREAIIAGEFEPGMRLTERFISEEFQVSRTVTREAFRQLEAERLIELIPNVGPMVSVLTSKDVKNLYQVRATLESLVGQLFAENATDEHLAQLQQSYKEISTKGSEDLYTLRHSKDAFTKILIDGSGNEVAGQMLQSINAQVSRLRQYTLNFPGRLENTKKELEKITEAALRRDSEATAMACREHAMRAAVIAQTAFDV